jgi:hypothetical protein
MSSSAKDNSLRPMESFKKGDRSSARWWGSPLLIFALLLGAWLRFTSLNWDNFKWIHPDESHMQQILSKIHTPDGDSALENIAVYFDTHQSPLNVRNQGARYSYGTLPLFVVRYVAEGLDQTCDRLRMDAPFRSGEASTPSVVAGIFSPVCNGGRFTGLRSKLVGRLLSATADMGTILLVFFIGRRLYGEEVGVLASALVALTAFLIQQAHFFTVDSMLCFFVTLTVYFTVRAGQTAEWVSFCLAGLSVGLAAACKLSGAYASLLVPLAGIVWLWSLPASHRRRSLWGVLLRLVAAGVLCLVAFRLAQPYAFEGPGFFGIRLSPEWLERLGQIRR